MGSDGSRLAKASCVLLTTVVLCGCSADSKTSVERNPTPSSTRSSASASASASPTSTPSPLPSVDQGAVVARLPGPADGSCVVVGGRNVRSGEIGAGDFSLARRQYKAGGKGVEPAKVSLNVIPAHPGKMAGVTMTMTRLRKPVFTYDHSSTITHTESGVQFYFLTFNVEQPGSWRLKITAGKDEGCFDVAFNRPL